MDRNQVRAIREDVANALLGLGAGLDVNVGRAKYDGTSVTYSVTVSEIHGGRVATPEANAFTREATSYDLRPEWLGRVFTWANTQYEVTGLRTRAPKRPVLVKRVSDGRAFCFPTTPVRLMLG